jgi:hypothetical protein
MGSDLPVLLSQNDDLSIDQMLEILQRTKQLGTTAFVIPILYFLFSYSKSEFES